MALRALNLCPADAELRALLDTFARGQTRVAFVPFCQMCAKSARETSGAGGVAALERAFAAFDPDGTGTVTAAALRDIFAEKSDTPLGDKETLDALVAYADADGGGVVKYRDFATRLIADAAAATREKEKGAAEIKAAKKAK